ncbi:hypothetical protein F4802DRAFT_566097 [Xylaria palmicola]|nr:hypothetical protein F4802DRAFT_566097 [Xylaria palmicola]
MSAVLFNIYCGLVINYIFNVSHFHAFDFDLSLGLDEAMNLALLSYITELIFTVGNTTIKLSILWFYFSLFSINRTLRPVIQATAVVCVVWFVVAGLVVVLQCQPVQAFWEQLDSPVYCLESPRVLLGYELSNLFIDVAILCIPTSTVGKLQLPLSKKLPLIGIFLLGAVVCIASILRLTAIWNPPDIEENLDFGRTFFWSTLQLGLAIVTSCLPTYGPLMVLLPRPYHCLCKCFKTPRGRSAIGGSQDGYKAHHERSPERPWIRVGDGRADGTTESWVYGGRNYSGQYALQPVQPRGIVVNTRVDVV